MYGCESKEQVSSKISDLFLKSCINSFLIMQFLNSLRFHCLHTFFNEPFSKDRNVCNKKNQSVWQLYFFIPMIFKWCIQCKKFKAYIHAFVVGMFFHSSPRNNTEGYSFKGSMLEQRDVTRVLARDPKPCLPTPNLIPLAMPCSLWHKRFIPTSSVTAQDLCHMPRKH